MCSLLSSIFHRRDCGRFLFLQLRTPWASSRGSFSFADLPFFPVSCLLNIMFSRPLPVLRPCPPRVPVILWETGDLPLQNLPPPPVRSSFPFRHVPTENGQRDSALNEILFQETISHPIHCRSRLSKRRSTNPLRTLRLEEFVLFPHLF